MEEFFVKEKPGCVVNDPDTGKRLAPEGEWKPTNTFWLRRVRDEDIEVLKRGPKTKPAEKAKA